jgi:hypothetical protein
MEASILGVMDVETSIGTCFVLLMPDEHLCRVSVGCTDTWGVKSPLPGMPGSQMWWFDTPVHVHGVSSRGAASKSLQVCGLLVYHKMWCDSLLPTTNLEPTPAPSKLLWQCKLVQVIWRDGGDGVWPVPAKYAVWPCALLKMSHSTVISLQGMWPQSYSWKPLMDKIRTKMFVAVVYHYSFTLYKLFFSSGKRKNRTQDCHSSNRKK